MTIFGLAVTLTFDLFISKSSHFIQGHRVFPGIAQPKIPGGNSREFLKFRRELRGIYRSFVFFSYFYC